MRRKLDTGEGDAAAAGAGAGGGGAGAEESGDEEGKVEGTETQQVGESEEGKEEGGASSESENSGGEDGEGGKPGKRKRVGKKGKEKRKKKQKTDLWKKQGAVVYQSPEAFGVEWAEETYPGHLQRKVMQGVVKTVTKRKNKVHSVIIEYKDKDTATWVLDDIKEGSVYEISSLDVDFVAYEKEKAAVGGSKGGKK